LKRRKIAENTVADGEDGGSKIAEK